jgi:transketolase
MIVARTIKGKGVSFIEGKDGWHGKPLKKGDELGRALAELEAERVPAAAGVDLVRDIPKPRTIRRPAAVAGSPTPPAYTLGEQVATREAYGTAITKLGAVDANVVALDADVKNSTFGEKFEAAFPDRFYQNFIAEQVMIGAAMGLAARGAIPFAATFACFLSRAYDFVRMAAISDVGVKMAGSQRGETRRPGGISCRAGVPAHESPEDAGDLR